MVVVLSATLKINYLTANFFGGGRLLRMTFRLLHHNYSLLFKRFFKAVDIASNLCGITDVRVQNRLIKGLPNHHWNSGYCIRGRWGCIFRNFWKQKIENNSKNLFKANLLIDESTNVEGPTNCSAVMSTENDFQLAKGKEENWSSLHPLHYS